MTETVTFFLFKTFFINLGRILAVDYGRKRVGLAVTDPGQTIANSLTTIHASEIWEFLKAYISKEKVDIIVVGYPKTINNKPSEAVKYINPFVKKLKETYPDIKIDLADERFTSQIAFQAMIDGGVKKKKRQDKAMVDKISANLILQSYIDKIKY